MANRISSGPRTRASCPQAFGMTISGAVGHRAAQCHPQYAPTGSEVEIDIQAGPTGWQFRDRGSGVPDALNTALFDRFNRGKQAHRNSGGSGIGLAIMKSVATSHDARVSLEGREGE